MESAELPAPVAEPITVTNEFNPLEPGLYESEFLPVKLKVQTTAVFNVTRAEAGEIEMVGIDRGDDYFGVGFFEVDTLVRSDANGHQLERYPATTDLSGFLGQLDGSIVVAEGEGSIGGLSGSWWRISWSAEDDCCWESLFQTMGWQNLWGNSAGYDQTLWALEAADTLMLVVVEAPTEHFDTWSAEVDEHLFDQLVFGPSIGVDAQTPVREPIGPYRVGRLETEVTDGSRSIDQIVSNDRTVVPAADERALLLSVVYPSPTGGHDSQVSPGSHPLVISAHALFDAGLTLPPEQMLASHGYIVVTVRFPGVVLPGKQRFGGAQTTRRCFLRDRRGAFRCSRGRAERGDRFRTGGGGWGFGGWNNGVRPYHIDVLCRSSYRCRGRPRRHSV